MLYLAQLTLLFIMVKSISLALLLCVFTLFAHASEVDSVFFRAYKLLNNNLDSALYELSVFEGNLESLTKDDRSKFHKNAAQLYRRIGNYELESDHWMKLAASLPANSDTLHATLITNATALLNLGEFDKALVSFENGRDHFLIHTNWRLLSEAFNGIGTVASIQGDVERSIDNYLHAEEILSKLDSPRKHLIVLANMSNAYVEMGEIDKALKTSKRIYSIAIKMENQAEINYAGHDLGRIYNLLGERDSALLYLKPAKKYFEGISNPQMLSVIYSELGATYSLLKNFNKSESYYLKSIEILKDKNFVFPLPRILSEYGLVLRETQNFEKGIEICQEALPHAKALGYPDLEASVCECLYLNFKGNNQADSALFYYERQLILLDSISNVELQKTVLKKEMKFSFSQEKEVIIADANAVIADEKGLRKVWVIGAFILLAALIILYLAFRQKQKSGAIIQREKQYLDNLLHNLVHEFRTPLTLIKGPTEELLKNDSKNKLLLLVDKNSDQMLSLVNQVLDFAKIKAGRLDVNNEIANVNLFTDDIIALFQSISQERGVKIEGQRLNENPTISVDVDKLFKIVSNLLSNAIKYSNEGAQVNLKTKVTAQWLELVVSDTGIGISDRDQKQVFNKFYQVDATITRKGEGTGLGLAFVRELVLLMEGEISLMSTLGQGTEVMVKLPIELVENDTKDNEISKTIQESQEPAIHAYRDDSLEDKKKLLIIEDNKDLQDFLSQILRDQGYEIHNALNGEEGVEMALEIVPDLVISDVMMPKMDGYQVVQHLKNDFATEHIPIIILSAKASFDSMIEGLGAGADDYLSKPFKSQELVLRIANQIMGQERLRQKYLQTDNSETPIVKHALIEKIEAITKDDLTTQLSVEELAEKCALSRSQLHRKVKFITGLSTSALLTKIRLDLALVDLRTTDLSVSEIAYNYGYNDPAHFTKLFKKEFSRTPSEAKK